MAVTANYETVMIVSMKARESSLISSTRKAKAITFSLILRAQPSSPRSLTVSTRSQKASCVPSSSRRKTNNHIVGYIPNYERTKK